MAYCITIDSEKKFIPFDSKTSTIIPFDSKTSTIIPFDLETSIVKVIRSDGYQPLDNPDDYSLICGCGVYSPHDPLSRFLELQSAKSLLDNGILRCNKCNEKIGYIPRELVSSQ